MVTNPCCGTLCMALLAGPGSITPESWSLKLPPARAAYDRHHDRDERQEQHRRRT
jgi:hypothetical protein